MTFKQAITLSYAKNVGTLDRVFRFISGTALMTASWYVGWSTWLSVTTTILGAMWTSTAVLSKCSIYYALGYSTCPVSGVTKHDAHAPAGHID